MPGIDAIGAFASKSGLWQRGVEFVSQAVSNEYGQKLFGAAAYSPVGDYEVEYRQVVKGEKKEDSSLGKIWLFIKNKVLAWGYLSIIPGAIVKWLGNKLSPSMTTTTDAQGNVRHVPQEGSIFGSIVGLLGNLLMYGGPVLALVGQVTPFQEQFALGPDKSGEMQEKRINEKAGRDIYSELPVEKVHQVADDLRKKLTYTADIEGQIFKRSEIKGMPETAFICGSSGSGKTTGAMVILSNWARKVVALEGKNPFIMQISVPALKQGAEELRREIYAQAAMLDNAGKGVGDAYRKRASDPLLVFDLLLVRVRKLIDEFKNDPKHENERLAILIDEYDKLGDMVSEGVDFNKLVGILTGVNSLINRKEQNVPIIITANKTRKEYVEELKAAIPIDHIKEEDEQKQKEKQQKYVAQVIKDVIDPHDQRLGVIEVLINDPAPKEQAEILAKNLLLMFSPEVLSDIYSPTSGVTEEKSVIELRDILRHEISEKHGSNLLNGRFIEENVVQLCVTTLAGLADRKRNNTNPDNDGKRLGYTDAEWERLGYSGQLNEKLKAADVKLSLSGLKDNSRKAQIARFGEAKETGDRKYFVLMKNGIAKEAIKTYLRENKERIRKAVGAYMQGDGIGVDELLNILGIIYEKNSNNVFACKKPVEVAVDDKTSQSYIHAFSIDRNRKAVKVAMMPSHDVKTLQQLHSWDAALQVEHSFELPLDEFTANCTTEIIEMFGRKDNSLFGRIFNLIFKAAASGEKVKLDSRAFAEIFGGQFDDILHGNQI